MGFFLAVQKDVSLIKGLKKELVSWSCPEVCMWLEKNDLNFGVARFLDNRVEGNSLLKLKDGDLESLGFKLSDERERILRQIHADFDDAGNYRQSDDYAAVGGGGDELDRDIQRALEFEAEDFAAKTIWGNATAISGERITVKVLFRSMDPLLFLVAKPKTVEELKAAIWERLGRKFKKFRMVDEDGDEFSLNTDEEFETAMVVAESETLIISVDNPRRAMRGNAADALDCVDSAVVCVDAFGLISFANQSAVNLFESGNLFNKSITSFVVDLDKNIRNMAGTCIAMNVKLPQKEAMMRVSFNKMGSATSVITFLQN